MGKWIERLRAKSAQPLVEATDKTDETRPLEVLAVLAVTAGRVCANSTLAYTPADLAAVEWTDADMARFMDRRARLMRWGWAEAEAERQAEKLVLRDREADPRVSCTECQHYRPGRCANHKAAALASHEVGRDMATRLQRCPGFQGSQKHGATT
jgi:hypothetical protein